MLALKNNTAETNIDQARELQTVTVRDENEEGLVIPKGSKSVSLAMFNQQLAKII